MRAVSATETAPDTYAFAVGAQGLRVRAGRHMAVDGLDLTLDTGVHGLLGPNGAGKTTLMRALATVVRPAGGELTMLGTDVTARRSDLQPLRRNLGYLPQHFGFYPRFTVREFVEYMAWLKEMPKPVIPGAVQRAVERVGLADRADSKMKTLSGGMVRRAGIAQAIVNDPRVLLLDEPTVGLDPEQRLDFRDRLGQGQRRGRLDAGRHDRIGHRVERGVAHGAQHVRDLALVRADVALEEGAVLFEVA